MMPTLPAAWYPPPRPMHRDPRDEARGGRQMRRFALLNECFGDNDQDIRAWLEAHLGVERADGLGPADISANPLVTAAAQLATPGLYGLGAPGLRHASGDVEAFGALLAGAGYWTRMQYVQRQVFGVGDWILRLDAYRGRVTVRNALPWDVAPEVDVHDPARVVRLRERRLRLDRDGRPVWCWDVFSIEPGAEVYAVEDSAGHPASNLHLETPAGMAPPEGLTGDAYPYRYEDGTPYLPYQWYATEDTGAIWHDEGRRGATHGALNCIVRATWTGHAFHAATAAPIITVGVEPPARAITGVASEPQVSIPVIPGTWLPCGKQRDYDGQPLIYQSTSGAMLEAMGREERSYEQGQLARLGISTDDLMPQANPTSAGALALSRASKREIGDMLAPFFGASDARALGVIAAVARLGGIAEHPESGWTVRYPQIPLSADERAAQREDDAADLASGIVSPLTLWMRRNPGALRDEALAHFRQVAADNAAIGYSTAPTTPSVP